MGLSPGLTNSGYMTFGSYLKRLQIIRQDTLAIDFDNKTNNLIPTLGKYNNTGVEVKMERATATGNKMAWLVKSSGIEFGGKIFTLPRNSFTQFEIS